MAQAYRIIVKKKGHAGGHHGGAWKVAYADFVTAMMALFIVLWLLNSSKEVKEAVGGYFKDPTGTSKKVGNGQHGSGENLVVTKDNMKKIKQALQDQIKKVQIPEKLKKQIEMTITAEGLRIELMETDKGAFFPSGVPDPNKQATELLVALASELGKLPNTVSIEGHTDSKPFSTTGNYSNWELSADRANAARRIMQLNGLGLRQVTQVRGYADQCLRETKNPEAAANRRISVIVHYITKPGGDEEKTGNPVAANATPATPPGS
jgi:chemotaxis protein MotB